LIGIQVVNEAKWAVEGVWEWYESVIEEIGAISDRWDLGKAFTSGFQDL
jgi:hypothetical protein